MKNIRHLAQNAIISFRPSQIAVVTKRIQTSDFVFYQIILWFPFYLGFILCVCLCRGLHDEIKFTNYLAERTRSTLR